ncbi:MAG: CoA pyrophosphatase [Hyphomicrobiales bacterium]|nr:CoA pyrophosphatase [Hyphomicrobiales bacterium]
MSDNPFMSSDFIARARARLAVPPPGTSPGDHVLNPGQMDMERVMAVAKPAAVLIGLIDRPEGATVLLTERASHLRDHSGQIAFPGGRIDPQDASPLAAALREAEEEVGLARDHVAPLGELDAYYTGSGYRITPIVAQIATPFALRLNAEEVADAFETPLAFLMNEANHQRQSREWKGLERRFYAMPWNNRYIWGATAGILRNLYERLYP